jgi:hypothetical protein
LCLLQPDHRLCSLDGEQSGASSAGFPPFACTPSVFAAE